MKAIRLKSVLFLFLVAAGFLTLSAGAWYGSGPREMERAVGMRNGMSRAETGRRLATRQAESAQSPRHLLLRFVLAAVLGAGLLAVDASTAASASSSRDAGAKLRILLVEDNEDTRRLMGRLLRLFGHHVEAADCVAAALEVAGRERFDLLVSDIGLPDGTGWELMGRLGERRPPRAIAVSGFGMEEDVRRSREAGFAEHVTKPVNVAALRAVIDRVAATSGA